MSRPNYFKNGKYGPYLGILIAVVSVSFAAIFIVWCDAPPIVIAGYRMLFAVLLLLPFALGPCRKQCLALPWRTVLVLAGIGGVLALEDLAVTTALTMTTVAAVVLLVTAHPLIIGMVSIFYLRETDKRAFFGIILGFSGIVLLSINGFAVGNLTGDLLAVLACILASIYIISGRIMRQKVDIIPYAIMVYAFASLFLFAGCFATATQVIPMSWQNIVLFLLLAGVSTILGHTIYNWSLKYISASFVSVSLLGETLIASILAMFIFDQVPSSMIVVSGALLLAGVLIVAKYELRKTVQRTGS
jgi:drug/metabolite transporter (DMT)-like permease